MTTVARGNAAEAAVLHALASAGIHVLVPFGDGLAFDLAAVMPNDGSIVRIQVKSGRIRNGCVRFNTCGSDHGAGRQDYRGRADALAVHVNESGAVYMIAVDDCPAYTCQLGLGSPRNNQHIGVRLAENYSLQRWLQSAQGG
jgi:hypothetical protein